MKKPRRTPFLCPECGAQVVRVLESRPWQGAIRRRRVCPAGHVIWTRETVVKVA